MKRYNLGSRWTDTPCSGDRQVADMRIAEDGYFVTFEDYSKLQEVIKEFFGYLDHTEVSDSGKEFNPVSIGCCRTEILIKMSDCLKKMKDLLIK